MPVSRLSGIRGNWNALPPGHLGLLSLVPWRSSGLCRGWLQRVPGGAGAVGAAGRSVPDQHARFRLRQPPPLGLLAPVMVPAKRGEVTFTGPAALVPRGGVVQ